MKYLLLQLILLLSAGYTSGQTIADTIYYDSNGARTTKDNYSYFRTVAKDSEGLYNTKEYGKTGNLQMCGKFNGFDPEARHGEFKWYHDNGAISKIITYEDNVVKGKIRAYNSAGELLLEYILNLGDLDNAKAMERKIRDFSVFVSKSLKYPEKPQEEGVGGKVYTRFFVDTAGIVFRVSVINSFNADLDKEAIRVVSAYNEWPIPYYRGEKCNVEFVIPIIFVLQ